MHPLDAFPRLLDCVATNRPPDEEDRFRFQWFGLFYQAPAQDAFVLRLRLPGGRLRPFQLAGLAEITQRFAGGQVVPNIRGGLDVPGVPITSAGRILSEVEGIGLSTRRAGGDCVQAIRGGEYDDIDSGVSDVPVCPLVCALEQATTVGLACADLPGPCEIVFQAAGETEIYCEPAIDTLTLRAAARLSPAEENTFLLIPPHDVEGGFKLHLRSVVPCCLSLLELWKFGADRSSRENAGLARFLRGIDPATLRAALGGVERVPLPRVPSSQEQRISGCAIPGGRLLSGQLTTLAQRCREQGWREIRLARGCIHPVGLDGKWVNASEILVRL